MIHRAFRWMLSAMLGCFAVLLLASPSSANGPNPPPTTVQIALAANLLAQQDVYASGNLSPAEARELGLLADNIIASGLPIKAAYFSTAASTMIRPRQLVANRLLEQITKVNRSWHGWVIVVVAGEATQATNRPHVQVESIGSTTGAMPVSAMRSWVHHLDATQPWYNRSSWRPYTMPLRWTLGILALAGLIWLYVWAVQRQRQRPPAPAHQLGGRDVEFQIL